RQPAAGVRRAEAADRPARGRRRDAADRARIVHGESRVALHLSVRRASAAAGDPRARRGGVRALHRAPPRRPRLVLSWSAAAMRCAGCGMLVVVLSIAGVVELSAQAREGAAEPLQLAALQREAREADARGRELALLASQTDLRLRNLDVERLPAVTA